MTVSVIKDTTYYINVGGYNGKIDPGGASTSGDFDKPDDISAQYVGGQMVLTLKWIATVDVEIAGENKGTYNLEQANSTRQSYNANNGPLVTSANADIISSTRVLFSGVSYSELMGFPADQVTNNYWFPYYNNVAMASQLRVSNVGGASTTITVTYGDNIPLDSYTLAAGAATRLFYPINSGPLHVTSSNSNILTTIRVLYGNSYSEISGYPAGQLTREYYYPVYDNVNASSQLRVSNVGGVATTITVYGANNAVIDSYELAVGEATRKNYVGVNTGPLHVVSSDSDILSTQRLLYTTPSFGSYYELTGFPDDQLTTDYYFPWYNNVAMSSQLRIAVP